VGLPTPRAQAPYEALPKEESGCRCDHRSLNPKVEKAAHGLDRGIGVDRRQDEVTCKREPHRERRGLPVANFPDDDDVRIMPKECP
jgi:hypothetical protein